MMFQNPPEHEAKKAFFVYKQQKEDIKIYDYNTTL